MKPNHQVAHAELAYRRGYLHGAISADAYRLEGREAVSLWIVQLEDWRRERHVDFLPPPEFPP
jgi:hypothetical protein